MSREFKAFLLAVLCACLFIGLNWNGITLLPHLPDISRQSIVPQQSRNPSGIIGNRFEYKGHIFVPIKREGEDKKVLYDDGYELFAYQSYDENTKQCYMVYFQTFGSRRPPIVKAIVPQKDNNGNLVFYR